MTGLAGYSATALHVHLDGGVRARGMHGAGYKWVLVKEGEEKAPPGPARSGRQPTAEAEELSSTSSLDGFYGGSVRGPGGAPADAERIKNQVGAPSSSRRLMLLPQTLYHFSVTTHPRAVLGCECDSGFPCVLAIKFSYVCGIPPHKVYF